MKQRFIAKEETQDGKNEKNGGLLLPQEAWLQLGPFAAQEGASGKIRRV